jgi:hypothetical protein
MHAGERAPHQPSIQSGQSTYEFAVVFQQFRIRIHVAVQTGKWKRLHCW